MKKNIARIITFAAGAFFLLEFVLPAKAPSWLGGFDNPFTAQFDNVSNFLKVLGAMALLVGPINLIRGELKTISRRKPGWIESIVFFVFLVASTLAASLRTNADATGFRHVMSVAYDAMFYGINSTFYMTSMGLVSFYLVSAAHRAFRLNSLESALMMLAATIVMLALTPVGDVMGRGLPGFLKVGTISQWILSTPNTAVQKAVLFGTCGGAFVAAMRQWLCIGKDGK